MRSKFSIAGHPLHAMLVVIPIGLFLWAFVAQVVFIAQDEQLWYDISFWSAIAAVVTALLAAAPGFGDYMTLARKSDANAIATAHMVLNIAVIALYFVAIMLMLDNGATDGSEQGAVVALMAAGSAALLASGWLGGEMVYRHHIGVNSDTEELAAQEIARHEVHGAHSSATKPASERK